MNASARTRAVLVALCALAGSLAFASPSSAERLDASKALARSEAAVGRTLGAYTLTDSSGAPLALRIFRGKPLVISLVYTACSSVCPTATQHLINAVSDARRVIGADRFNVLTVGFDARNDTPARLAQFASTQGITGPEWRLASADAGTLEALLRDLGFSYATIAGGFDHVTQTTIVDAEGRIYRHVYGDDFPLHDVRRAAQGRRLRHDGLVHLQGRHRSHQVHLHDLRSRRRALPHRLRADVRKRHRRASRSSCSAASSCAAGVASARAKSAARAGS